jgi:hypothetical protein
MPLPTGCRVSCFKASSFDQTEDDSSTEPPCRRSSLSTRRCDRKPIPDSQKDERYFERREKNNAAAKKSRDARKQRIENVRRERERLRLEGEFLEAQLAAWRTACENMRAMLRQAEESDRMRHVTELLLDGGGDSSAAMGIGRSTAAMEPVSIKMDRGVELAARKHC